MIVYQLNKNWLLLCFLIGQSKSGAFHDSVNRLYPELENLKTHDSTFLKTHLQEYCET